MNKIKFILPALAFVFAISGAFVTNGNVLTSPGFYQVVDDPTTPQNERACNSGTTNEDNCATTNGGAQCTINVSGNPAAWNTKTGNTCSSALKLP